MSKEYEDQDFETDVIAETESFLSWRADEPDDEDITSEKVVCDIAGQSWGNYFIPDYADHLPEFILYKNGDHYTWEFSMKVYDDSYDPVDPDEGSLVILQTGKIMGLSLAYCDNDTPGTQRDNFFGSVYVPEAAFNDHWKDADGFGVIKLVEGGTTRVPKNEAARSIRIYPNPVQDILHINNIRAKDTEIRIYNLVGNLVEVLKATESVKIDISQYSQGVYLIQIEGSTYKIIKE